MQDPLRCIATYRTVLFLLEDLGPWFTRRAWPSTSEQASWSLRPAGVTLHASRVASMRTSMGPLLPLATQRPRDAHLHNDAEARGPVRRTSCDAHCNARV